jgi:putative CocE/NonD family hydrolase
MKHTAPVVALIILGVGWFTQPGTSARGQTSPAPQARPASLAGLEDSGVFLLYQNEDRVGTITFKWQAGGTLDNEMVISVAGQSTTITQQILVDKDGLWTKMTSNSAQGLVETVREGDTAKITVKGKTQIVKLEPGARLFGNYAPALMSQAVKLYDRAKGGKQEFALLINAGAMMSGSLEYKDTVERSVGGRDLRFSRYLYGLPGVDITVWIGEDGKVYLGDVPAQHAAYVREGYEILRREAGTDPLISQPSFDVKLEQNVAVPMRDGAALSTNIYRPDTAGNSAVILVRTPYKKEMADLQARYYARRGYVFAVQDCRGRFGSSGTWEPFVNEPRDGYDAVEWLARQPWSTGKVGMIGGSYVGWVQWWAARERPPHLVTIIPNVSPPDPFYNMPYEHGAFFTLGAIWWADILESNATADISGAAMGTIGDKKYGQLLKGLPVIDLDKTVLGRENKYWRTWIAHPVNDAYWARANFLDQLREVKLPVFHQSGWYDGDGIGTKLNYLAMKRAGHQDQKVVIGPWGHTDQAARRIGDRDFGPQAIVDLQRDYLRWFDYWLKGVDNGILKEPLVKIFVMGSNKWLEGNVYPLPETQFQKWYLTSGGHANTSKGDGGLRPELPAAASQPDKYAYDPGDPTPMPEFYETPADAPAVSDAEEAKKEREAHHENVTQSRQDILVYVTEPLKEALTFAGPVSATIYASSSARDTDWFMSLMEVDQAGKIFPLTSGRVRARFRQSTTTPKLLQPGRVYEYVIDLWQTGITIPAGRRLRVEVASASFPVWSRNLNTGGHNETETKYVVAHQAVYHDARHPSHVLLPVIPKVLTRAGR